MGPVFVLTVLRSSACGAAFGKGGYPCICVSASGGIWACAPGAQTRPPIRKELKWGFAGRLRPSRGRARAGVGLQRYVAAVYRL